MVTGRHASARSHSESSVCTTTCQPLRGTECRTSFLLGVGARTGVGEAGSSGEVPEGAAQGAGLPGAGVGDGWAEGSTA